ncbi:plasmid mobilization relaxosome protein MobC [Acetobacter sp. AAB5]|uniref:plasmid mobilization relaxosome protein MobC n=1 Tax=Acetobacter sp. AAB5 TaxID=3418370 RepID=UPI003CFB2DBD
MPIVRTSHLSVRASPAELDRWNSVAHHLGHATTAHWIRALLATSELAGDNGQQVGSELYSLRHALSRIGNNLNQLAHSAHCGDTVYCETMLSELENRLQQIDLLLARSGRQSTGRRCARPARTLH